MCVCVYLEDEGVPPFHDFFVEKPPWGTLHPLLKSKLPFQEFLLNKIQFNSFYINMWLSSLNISEENQFIWDKKEKHFTQLICDKGISKVYK